MLANHAPVERWADAGLPRGRRALSVHVQGASGDVGLTSTLRVRHRQQLLLQFRHVLVQHEVSLTGVPVRCAAALASSPHALCLPASCPLLESRALESEWASCFSAPTFADIDAARHAAAR